MRNIIKDIEQLEVAGDLIEKNTPTSSRLALFLIDNLSELIMHKICLNEFARDDQFKNIRDENLRYLMPSKYSTTKRKKIKKYFRPKVNFILNDLKLINESDATVIKFGHYLRNEAYHNGVLREIMITPITRIYFQTICLNFTKLWIGSYAFSSHNEIREFLIKYGIDADLITSTILDQIFQKILYGRDIKEIELAEAISKDLVTRIQEIFNALEDLSSEPRSMSPEEGLKWLQFREEGGLEFGQYKDDEEFRLFWKEVPIKLAAFKPKVSLTTLTRWKEQANTIKNEKDKKIILQKYQGIDKQLIRIENMVQEELLKYAEEYSY